MNEQKIRNPMRRIRIEKLTLNIGAGTSSEALDKAMKLLRSVAGVSPVKTFASKRIPTWGLRPGMPIGCMLTLRGGEAHELVKRLIAARDNTLRESQFDNHGNVSFGIPEYIDIPGVNYDPEIGIKGLQVCITLKRPGFRIKKRRIHRRNIPKRSIITREEAMAFMKEEFNISIGEKE
ncbi:50S ribosomal protein L5 [Candidatus Woesearchaeota archaeon CG08_land_8_20_14_0_20_47_9]|nr:MAG: 50S ribosomal protein L5 [Candidatus Woesearchaeota archaeon CG1_02_47_18]PIN73808.1 MAG: 50S ribosomal protein L5 [Candidatus Woesearchaeota archaeon CG10_big_fil_rev_8_21_14_0_10_47_5]PIO04095.1 MAG: 50S ribosomal protein L5 [Candidatus Woesearchaeota archaeon CG08_land_8_20_14_0_20_47_9]HII29786.1 50S ribosomal protein L5 [Candidatus Woesearchaeota archaeon]